MSKSNFKKITQELNLLSLQDTLDVSTEFEKKTRIIQKIYDEKVDECQQRLQKISEGDKITIKDFAEKVLDCSKATYYSQKSAKGLPKLEYFIRISEFLGCPLSVLMGEGDANKLSINNGLTAENARKLRKYEYDIDKYKDQLSFINYFIEKSDDLIPILNRKTDILKRKKQLLNDYHSTIKEIVENEFNEKDEENTKIRISETDLTDMFDEFIRIAEYAIPGKTYTDGFLKTKWNINHGTFSIIYNENDDSFDGKTWDTLIAGSLAGYYTNCTPKRRKILKKLFGICATSKSYKFNIEKNHRGKLLLNNIRDRFFINGAMKEIDYLLNNEIRQIIQDFYYLNFKKNEKLYDFTKNLIDTHMPEYTDYGKVIAYTNTIDSGSKCAFSYLAITINENDSAFRIAAFNNKFEEVEVELNAIDISSIKKYNNLNEITLPVDLDMNKGEQYLSSICGSYSYCKDIISVLYNDNKSAHKPIVWRKEFF